MTASPSTLEELGCESLSVNGMKGQLIAKRPGDATEKVLSSLRGDSHEQQCQSATSNAPNWIIIVIVGYLALGFLGGFARYCLTQSD